jgi:hypothetical protein
VKLGPFYLSASRSSIHRLSICWFWMDEESGSFGVAWGDRYSDPVWSVGFPDMRAPWVVKVVSDVRRRREIRKRAAS